MLTIEFINDGTGNRAVASYDYCVKVNGRVISTGRIEGHNRVDGWQGLIAQLAEKAKADRDQQIALEYYHIYAEHGGC